MTTTATHTEHDTTTARVLLMAFALRAKPWQLGGTRGPGHKPRERPVAARPQAGLLQAVLQATRRCGLPDPAPVVRGDAAGRDGCWRQRFFHAHGVTNPGVDASAMAVTRRPRRAQSDGWDVRPLLRMRLRFHPGARAGWRVGPVPAVAAEDPRHLPRDVATLPQARASTPPRLTGGRSRPGGRLTSRRQWPAPRNAWRRWEGAPMPRGRRRRVLRVSAQHPLLRPPLAACAAARRTVRHTSQAAPSAQGRQGMPRKGLGSHGSWWWVRAVFGWRAWQQRREVGGGAGGTPTPDHSGESARAHGLTTAGTRHGRWRTTAWAWSGGRSPPERVVSGWWKERCGGGGRRVRRMGSVAVARQCLMALGRCLEPGGFPEGAERTAASAIVRCCGTPGSRDGWRRPVAVPGVPSQPSERWGRLPQACQRSSQDAESMG
jgi:transposase